MTEYQHNVMLRKTIARYLMETFPCAHISRREGENHADEILKMVDDEG